MVSLRRKLLVRGGSSKMSTCMVALLPKPAEMDGARRPTKEKIRMTTLCLQLDVGLLVKVKIVVRRPDHREDRRILVSGNILEDVFARTQPNPLTSSFLQQSSERLQNLLTDWYTNEQVCYDNFLRLTFGLDPSVLQTKNSASTQRE